VKQAALALVLGTESKRDTQINCTCVRTPERAFELTDNVYQLAKLLLPNVALEPQYVYAVSNGHALRIVYQRPDRCTIIFGGSTIALVSRRHDPLYSPPLIEFSELDERWMYCMPVT